MIEGCNCTGLVESMKRYYLPVAYGTIFVVGLLGNLTSIFIYVTKLRPWKSSSIIMVNLALTDLLYVLSMPFLVYYYSSGDQWVLGDFMCRFVRFSFHFHLYGSILFLTCFAVFRYVVVVRPLLAAQVQQRVWGTVACLAVWVLAATEIMPMWLIISSNEVNNQTVCLDFASSEGDMVRWYSWVLGVLGFLLPLVVVYMCYISVVRQLAKGPSTSSPSRIRARRVTMLILAVFVLCFLPYHILRALRIETKEKVIECVDDIVHTAYIFSRPLAGLNTFFNLVLYTLSGDRFKVAFLSIVCRVSWRCKSRSLQHVAIVSKTGSDTPATGVYPPPTLDKKHSLHT